jgi:hypothetical protein
VIKAHLSIYDTPEAIYTWFAGEQEAAVEALLPFVPAKTVLTTTVDLEDLVKRNLKSDAIYPNDFMVVNRGEEKLRSPSKAKPLSREFEVEYSTFGETFNVPPMPIEWIREMLDKNIIFGSFDGGKLVTVASLVA